MHNSSFQLIDGSGLDQGSIFPGFLGFGQGFLDL